jgi:hypothetical protein
LIVFENAFLAGGNPDAAFAEPGQVSVSEDGSDWKAFPCDPDDLNGTSCAGLTPVLSNPDNGADPTAPEEAGGDAFDLQQVGLSEACFVRIRDMAGSGPEPMAGFDLDAVAAINTE